MMTIINFVDSHDLPAWNPLLLVFKRTMKIYGKYHCNVFKIVFFAYLIFFNLKVFILSFQILVQNDSFGLSFG